jgi:hypothetical protein
MSLAVFNAETASGEGAHGPDRSRLAKCYHCSTNRQKRQSAAETGSAGVIYRNRQSAAEKAASGRVLGHDTGQAHARPDARI